MYVRACTFPSRYAYAAETARFFFRSLVILENRYLFLFKTIQLRSVFFRFRYFADRFVSYNYPFAVVSPRKQSFLLHRNARPTPKCNRKVRAECVFHDTAERRLCSGRGGKIKKKKKCVELNKIISCDGKSQFFGNNN